MSDGDVVEAAAWQPWAERLRSELAAVVRRRRTESILLSGGLDTGILAHLLAASAVDGAAIDPDTEAGNDDAGPAVVPSHRHRGLTTAVTVVLDDADHPDLAFSRRVAERYDLEHVVERVDLPRLEEAMRAVIRCLDTFDPMTLRNQAVIQIGLERLVGQGVESVMTGDGADELFAGYDFYRGKGDGELEADLRRLWSAMSFDSTAMGRAMGLRVESPFLDPALRGIAEAVVPRWLVGPVPGGTSRTRSREASSSAEDRETTGKWLLRKAFEEDLPRRLVWRRKDPIEVGSGAAVLPERYADAVPAARLEAGIEKARDRYGVRIRDAEHLRYLHLYLEVRGAPDPGPPADKRCPDCRVGLPLGRRFCKRCGAWPVPDPGETAGPERHP